MPVGPVRQRDHRRTCLANELDDRQDLFGDVAQLPIGQPEIDPPVRAQHRAGVLGLALTLFGRAVAAHLAARQVAQSDFQALGDVVGDGGAHADFDVVRVGAEREDVYGRHGE